MRQGLRHFRLDWLALLTGVLPIVGINGCYLLAAGMGHVPWCFPYSDGCISISATGRHPPEAWVFRATMIPGAVLLALFWPFAARWLAGLGDTSVRMGRSIVVFGMTAAVFLVVYAIVLGEVGELYSLQRRTGATIYFAFTFLAQLLVMQRLGVLQRGGSPVLSARWRYVLLTPCVLMLGIGLASVVWQLLLDGYDRVEDSIEWLFALFMHAWFVACFFAWRDTGFGARLHVSVD